MIRRYWRFVLQYQCTRISKIRRYRCFYFNTGVVLYWWFFDIDVKNIQGYRHFALQYRLLIDSSGPGKALVLVGQRTAIAGCSYWVLIAARVFLLPGKAVLRPGGLHSPSTSGAWHAPEQGRACESAVAVSARKRDHVLPGFIRDIMPPFNLV